MNNHSDGEFDRFDQKIMDILAEEGRISLTALAERVGLSKTPCQARFRRLVTDGYIEGFRAIRRWCMNTPVVDFVVIDSRSDSLMTVFQ